MIISYKYEYVRNYCFLFKYDIKNIPFSIETIIAIRAIIADLRAAPCLAEAPIIYYLGINSENENLFIIDIKDVKIFFIPITKITNPLPNQVKRIKIIDVIRNPL